MPLQTLIDKYIDYPEFLGLRVTAPTQRGYSGDTLLHLVASVGTLEGADLLVAANVNVDSVVEMNDTPLHSAASRGSLTMVEHLLELGADPTFRNEFGLTPAEMADESGRTDVAAFIRGFNKLHKDFGGGGSVWYVYDGDEPVAEVNDSGVAGAAHTFGANGLVSRRSGSGTIYYTFDPQGGVVQQLMALGDSKAITATGGQQKSPISVWRFPCFCRSERPVTVRAGAAKK